MMNLDIKILSYALSEKHLFLKVQSSIAPDYFQTSYQVFYKLLLKCFEKFREIPTPRVMEEQSSGVWNETYSQIYSDILATTSDAKELPADLEKFKLRYNTQLLLKVGKDVFKDRLNNETSEFEDLGEVNKILKKAASNIDLIYKNKVFKEGSLSQTAKEAWAEYKRVKDNPELARGIHVGFKEFDRITNGIQPAELILIGGESSAGKSALSMNMAINAWLGSNKVPKSVKEVENYEFNDSGKNILYFSLEMPYKPFRRRVDACIAGISLYGIRDGVLNDEEIKKFQASLKFQLGYKKQLDIIDIPRGCTVEHIETKYVEKCYEYQPDLIVIDYLTLMSSGVDVGSDWLNLGKISESVHEFCRTYNIPVVSPVQLTKPKTNSNGKKDENGIADQNRIGRSIMLPQNANIILNIESRPDEKTRRDMLIRIAKMRDGETTTFSLHKRFDMMRIYDGSSDWNPDEYYGDSDGSDNRNS
jgi:replicative DNA helicase